LIGVLLAAAILLTGIIGSPLPMEERNGAQATIARNMPRTGDWVAARLAIEDRTVARIEAVVAQRGRI
jgi:4-amino-4-deoxy-L-arabinose transferase-like glycosyltransferase